MRHAIVVLAVGGILASGGCKPAVTTPPESVSPPALPSSDTRTPSPTPTPTIVKRRVTETRSIRYATRRVGDAALARGTTRVRQRGVKGVLTLTYEVTLTNGERTRKRLVRRVVTRAPVTRIVAVGTRVVRHCDPNYGGACVPIASDVDCAGGSGNGPAYLSGTARVIGTDVYDLDRDGDGIACDDG
jgi:resuscitation-promoting factor RpfB